MSKITTEQLVQALSTHNVPHSKMTLEKLSDEYNNFCPNCANPNFIQIKKFDCGCGGGGKAIPASKRK